MNNAIAYPMALTESCIDKMNDQKAIEIMQKPCFHWSTGQHLVLKTQQNTRKGA